MEKTYCRLNGRWAYLLRAIDQNGQVVGVYMNERDNAGAAGTLCRGAIGRTSAILERVVTASCYPPALRTCLANVEYQCSRYLKRDLERNHGHLGQRLRLMRGFKLGASTGVLVRGQRPSRISARASRLRPMMSRVACASR